MVDLSPAGKVLTMALIIAGVGSVSYGALSAAEFVVEGHLRHVLERRRMQREIARIGDHTIICGFGRVGRHLADLLAREGYPFVVVDDDEDKIALLEELGYLHVRGDATEEQVLREAGLDRARAVVAAVNSDADNALIALTVKGLRPEVQVIARAKLEENEAEMRRAGADRVIAPTTIGARRIAQILTRPVVADFLEGLGGATEYTFEEVPVQPGSPLDGVSLRDARIRERYGVTVLAVRHQGRLDTHPDPDAVLHAGDVLVVMGSERECSRIRGLFGG